MPSPPARSAIVVTGRPRVLVAISLAAAITVIVLGGKSASHLETLWDEQVDHDIAVDLRHHPLTGGEHALDASQTRLPMYACALVFAATGRDDLAIARGVSLAAGAFTVLAAAALAYTCFGQCAAALAVVLLALSPYFLSFARISMTEGDIFFSLFFTAAMWAFVSYLKRPSAGWWWLAAVLTGLAIGSKVFAIAVVPVFAVLVFSSPPIAVLETNQNAVLRLHKLLIAGLVGIVITLAIAMMSKNIAILGWLLVLTIWISISLGLRRTRALAPNRLLRFAGLVVFSLITCASLMPVHLTDHQIAREIARRLLRWDNSFPLAFWSDHLRLYAGIVLIKMTVPLGILSAIALVFAAFRERDDGRWRACILGTVFYLVLICLLPLRQTFYLMGVYPLIVIIAAAFLTEIGTWLARRSKGLATVWALAVVAMLIWLGIAASQTFPWFHLHGYSLVGDRWLGAESRGYRNLIQTPSDGVESLIKWCNTDPRVHRGDTVVSYLWEERIIDSVLPPDHHYRLIRRGLSQDTDRLPPPPAIDNADFVLVHINNLLGYGDRPPDMPPRDLLSTRFEVVHTVRRGPLAVGWVYARR